MAASAASGRGGLGGSIGQPISGYGRPGGGVRPDHPTPAGRHIALHRLLLRACGERPGTSAAEQRYELAPPHSITSSASASRLSEILSPSIFAVFRLIISSNLVGCCGVGAALIPRHFVH